MQFPKTPADETQRLIALHCLKILDTPQSETFDRVTRRAGQAQRAPIVLVSLVDQQRQWFKSRIGLPLAQTSRDVSFCGHAVFAGNPLVVPDAMADARFVNNPLVTGAPHIRSYLGIPIYTSDQQPVGTLCVIDVVPREFTATEIAALGDFAKIIEEILHAQEMSLRIDAVRQQADAAATLFRDTFELAAVGIVHTSPSGQVMRVNPRACEMLGYEQQELLAVSFVDITHPDDVAQNARHFQSLLAGEIDTYRIEKRFVRKDGSFLWTNICVSLKRAESAEPGYLIAVIDDVTDKKQVEAELLRSRDYLAAEVLQRTEKIGEQSLILQTQIKRSLESENAQRRTSARLRTILDNVPAMIGYWNQQLRCEFANENYRAAFGLDPARMIGMSMRQIMGTARFKKNEPYALMALKGQPQRFEHRIPKPDGTFTCADVRYLPDFNESREIRGFHVLATDVTALRDAHVAIEAANTQLKQDSSTDYLTGMANRRAFSERSEAAATLAHKTGQPYGLILLDVDNFKVVNDTYGHDVGDQVLAAIGRTLREQLRGVADLAARLGGEEFAVLCFGELNEPSLRQLAERLRLRINAQHVQTRIGSVAVTCSFGVAISCADDTDWKKIYARADAALYDAKSSGKDRVVYGRNDVRGATGKFRRLRGVPT